MTKPVGVFLQVVGALLLIDACAEEIFGPVIPGLLLMYFGRRPAVAKKNNKDNHNRLRIVDRLRHCGVEKYVAIAIDNECERVMASNSAKVTITQCCCRGSVTDIDLRRILEEAPGFIKQPGKAREDLAKNGMSWNDLVMTIRLDKRMIEV